MNRKRKKEKKDLKEMCGSVVATVVGGLALVLLLLLLLLLQYFVQVTGEWNFIEFSHQSEILHFLSGGSSLFYVHYMRLWELCRL